MSKRKKKSKSRKRKAHRSPKQIAAAKRNIKKAQRARRKGGKKKRGYGKAKRKGGSRRHAYHGGAIAARARFENLVRRLEAKGHDRRTAEALAHRAQRMVKAMGRGAAKHKVGVAAQQQAMANLFGGIAAAGQLEALRR